ncbi:MAG: cation diffusion facilitator family transporter [Methanocalculus sp.]|uniref:cation diffusion facilitator family transporter n=1 Tax=Methanocalculus sp. TaxID=2004547 RepID=UPI00271DFDEF|nr:cation diffusion facilitator family transporter [Methanocalculus sp.]MDO8842470.1 cation diffusion facilitator family transporter [Methanocalculus sp.]MDO9539085.1 cation diffusion facilitator family transporter [Methanocalculus sp.]
MTDEKVRDFRRSIKIALFVTAFFFFVEVAGGLLSGSLALLSDAGHMFSDLLALILSFGAMTLALQLPTKERTYGYHRGEIFAAFINSLLLIGVSFGILWEAYHRLLNPAPVDGGLMLIVACIGLAANVFIVFLLYGSHNLNVRSAFLHVVGDTISSFAVIVAALWISFTGQVMADPILSGIIAILIMISAARIFRETIIILLQFTPQSVDFDAVVADMISVNGVKGVHNVHLWSLCSDINVLDAHVYSCESDMGRNEQIKQEIKERLKKYRILHSTLEFECDECRDCALVEEIREHTD